MLIKSLKLRKKIRIKNRTLRKSLTLENQYHESIKISEIAFNWTLISNSKNIAVFLPFDGEINTHPLILKLWSHNNRVFLPVINSFCKKKILFVQFTPSSILHSNKYKILEPYFKSQDIVALHHLDVILVPLVAFDKKGSRLGMGGGFYDILLKNWSKRNFFPVGFAYNFQLVDFIPRQSWDVSLPAVLTPEKIWIF